ncbi:MAG: hypothetical protein LQ345_002813 [Seirophora villosa]|nr:MAG: hypothetical protein LQ345_002813 [Seirophora villosa]
MSKYPGRGGRSHNQPSQVQATSRAGSKTSRRQVTLYDAAAGRISTTGFITSSPEPSSHRDTTRTSYLPLPPEEVLFRRRNAPERYEEDDTYFAHENLDPRTRPLPDSDLLKAVHAYASDFYGAVLGKQEEGMVSFGSMDETALMAVGVLLEEAVGRLVEGTGDLVFVEGARRGEDEVLEQLRRKRQARKHQSTHAETVDSSAEGEDGDTDAEGSSSDLPSMAESSASGRMRKRRRLEDEGSDLGASSGESEIVSELADSSDSVST